jgi:hypothetical protein
MTHTTSIEEEFMNDDREALARAAAQSLGDAMTNPTGPPEDPGLEARVEGAVAKALESLMGGGVGPQSFDEALADVDQRDSEAALKMLDWLLKTGRLQRIGVLDGGNGYLFGYVEPKGSSKQGYRPGGTEGDRIVDQAVDQARDSGTRRPDRQGMCPKCMAVVVEFDGEIVSESPTTSACPAGGTHELA